MKVRRGKDTLDVSAAESAALLDAWARVLIDVGTGDGRFVYRAAGEQPDTLCIGIDALGDNLERTAFRAARKPARGGRRNVLFVIAAADALPPELVGRADAVTVNYPWGTLLQALVAPHEAVLRGLNRLARPGAELTVLINQSVLDDRAYAARLGLPELTDERVATVLRPAWASAGLQISEWALTREAPHRTSWGRHLSLASGRVTRVLRGVCGGAPVQPAPH